MSFFEELKRRNVLRVAAAYAIVAWLLIQVTETIFPLFGFDDTPARIVVIVLGIGLIPTIIFAWAFEMTPEGLKKERDVDRSQSITPVTGKKLDRMIMVVLALAVGYFAFDKFVLDPQREMAKDEQIAEKVEAARAEGRTEAMVGSYGDKSIAVLPFVNMSSDKEQEYFSDGISEEMLNLLAKFSALRVISRSSAFAFKDKDIEIPEIARRLNVAHILEGSVRKSGSKIRITAQLIEARSDTHLWSETYDRNLDDIFAIQDEISAAIVGELVDRLGVEVSETASDSEVPETSSSAYDTYLLAQHNMNKKTTEGYDRAKLLYQQAISEDPEYAPAYAQLGIVWLLNALGYGSERIEMEVALKEAEPLIEKALQLDPRNATAYAARGLWLRQNGQVADSIPVLLEGLKYNPSNSYARNWLSMAYRILMRSKDELETLREGHRRDPLYPSIAWNLVKSLSRFGKFDEANEVLQHLKDLDLSYYGGSGAEFLQFQGEYAKAIETSLSVLDDIPEGKASTSVRVAADFMSLLGEIDEALRLDPWKGEYVPFANWLRLRERDPVLRHEYIEAVYGDEVSEDADYFYMWTLLGLGEDYEARIRAQRSMEYTPVEDPLEIAAAEPTMVLAILDYKAGDARRGLDRIALLEEVVGRNLADGDMFAHNYLVKAVAGYMRGDEDATYRYLKEGFDGKASMSFEGYVAPAIFDALNWNTHPRFAALIEAHEAYNQAQLTALFTKACAGEFSAWAPLDASCARYVP